MVLLKRPPPPCTKDACLRNVTTVVSGNPQYDPPYVATGRTAVLYRRCRCLLLATRCKRLTLLTLLWALVTREE